jgi:hypothetical protein
VTPVARYGTGARWSPFAEAVPCELDDGAGRVLRYLLPEIVSQPLPGLAVAPTTLSAVLVSVRTMGMKFAVFTSANSQRN